METITNAAAEARELEQGAARLLKSLKGVADARVEVGADGDILRIHLVPAGIDERQAVRNAQSAIMAVLGHNVAPHSIIVAASLAGEASDASRPVAVNEPGAQVFELKPLARRNELNEAAKVAFETLRAAQSDFHGFQFDGAELVRIGGHQYVVVAVKRAGSEARYCGAAPVLDSVSTASARALMNAVGVATIHATPHEMNTEGERYETRHA
jgi:hypothetical protein